MANMEVDEFPPKKRDEDESFSLRLSNYYAILSWWDCCTWCGKVDVEVEDGSKCTTLCPNDVFSGVPRREGTKRNNRLPSCRRGDECHHLHLKDILDCWIEFYYHNDDDYDDGDMHHPTRIMRGKVVKYYGEISDYESRENPHYYYKGMYDPIGMGWYSSSEEEFEEQWVEENEGLTGIPGLVIRIACEGYGYEECDDEDVVWDDNRVIAFDDQDVLFRWILCK